LSEEITFGFRAGAVEQTSPSGGYHCYLPEFLSVMISPEMTYLEYGFKQLPTDRYYYHVPIDGILQAYCIILHLIKKHNRLEFLPDHLTIDSNNQEGEVE
jgi:hypothetical protein